MRNSKGLVIIKGRGRRCQPRDLTRCSCIWIVLKQCLNERLPGKTCGRFKRRFFLFMCEILIATCDPYSALGLRDLEKFDNRPQDVACMAINERMADTRNASAIHERVADLTALYKAILGNNTHLHEEPNRTPIHSLFHGSVAVRVIDDHVLVKRVICIQRFEASL